VTAPLDIEALRAQFLNQVFDEKTFRFAAADLADYARTCGETAARYTDPTHPDFQAPPTFPTSLHAGRRLPEGFPRFEGMGMDAGKAVSPKAPIRPDVTHVGRTHLHDIYTKTGRSGRMVFMVIRMELFDPAETLVATADTSMVIRERPTS
jgi:hypothetical protein